MRAEAVIEALFFDGDQTLWDFEKLMRRALAATLDELRRLCPGPATTDLDVPSLIEDRQFVAKELRGQETNLERLRLAGFQRTLGRMDLADDGLASHLTAHYLARRFDNVDLYPDVLMTLRSLQGAYTLGLLSNGNGYPDRSGLGGIFSAVVFAQDHGFEKPDRRLFDIAAAEAGCPIDRIAMVGDSLIDDVSGAQNSGWLGIWLNRDNRQRAGGLAPDAQITTLDELPAAIRQLNTCHAGRKAEGTGRVARQRSSSLRRVLVAGPSKTNPVAS